MTDRRTACNGEAQPTTAGDMEARRKELKRELNELRTATPSAEAVRQREALARKNVAAVKRSIETLNLRSLRSQLAAAGKLEASIDAMQNDIVKHTLQAHLMHHRGGVVTSLDDHFDELRNVLQSFFDRDDLSAASVTFRDFMKEVVTYGSR